MLIALSVTESYSCYVASRSLIKDHYDHSFCLSGLGTNVRSIDYDICAKISVTRLASVSVSLMSTPTPLSLRGQMRKRECRLRLDEFGPKLYENFNRARILPSASVPQTGRNPGLWKRKGQSADSSVLSHPMMWLDERIFGMSSCFHRIDADCRMPDLSFPGSVADKSRLEQKRRDRTVCLGRWSRI